MASMLMNYLKKIPTVNLNFDARHAVGFQAAVGIGVGVVFTGYVTLHTLLLDKFKDVFQLYKDGFVTPMSPETTYNIQQVVSDMRLSQGNQAYLKFFYTSATESVHMGSFKLRGGAYVGLPANFRYKSTADIERDLITIKTKPVSWNSQAGELFQDSLVLSDNAQKFTIAREMCHLNTHYVYNYGFISCAAIYVQYLTSSYLKTKTFGHLRPKSYRYSLYSLVGIFSFGLWSFATDTLTKYYENKADEEASALGLTYARGGVELYTKLARRNIASRELLGADGEKQFTIYGNPNDEIIRQRHVPVSIRKEKAEKRVQKVLGVSDVVE